jgi:hemolysin III
MKESVSPAPSVPAAPAPLPFQTLGEEIANSVLHGLGALLAAAGLVFLVHKANMDGKVLAVYLIFAAAMIGMFLASTLYHAIRHLGAKRIFRILDHSAIYFFIAGTYTPISLIGLGGAWGWAFFGIEWALAVTGVALYAANYGPVKKLELLIHLLMGWAIVIGGFPLIHRVPPVSLMLLVSGGAAYTLGTVWYRLNRRGTHVIWHVFVLAGAICHWWSVWFLR